jgi:hypothetical protein
MKRRNSVHGSLAALLALWAVLFSMTCMSGGGHGGGGGGGAGNQIINLNADISGSGPNITFTIDTNASLPVVVDNIGAVASDQLVTVAITLPNGVSFVSYVSTTPGWTCTAAGQTVTCTTSGSIAGLTGTSTVTVNVSVGPNAAGPASLGLSISTPDGTPSTHSGSKGVIFNNPAPTISSLSPISTLVGSGKFTLTVNGTNFVASSEVQWNGTLRATTFVSTTKLTAQIFGTDVAVAGTANVTVVNPSPGGGTTTALTFTINQPVPAITSITPSTATMGGSGFSLQVVGTNFVDSSKVQWNGSNLSTNVISNTILDTQIPSSDITTAGTAQVTVVNPPPGGGTSNAKTFTITSTPVISVAITQPVFSPVTVAVGASIPTFTATITNGASGVGVEWEVNGVVGGNSTVGTISLSQASSGQAVTYTAPASVPSPSTVNITAVYAGDTSIVSPAVVVSIVPNQNSLLKGQFALQMHGYYSTVSTPQTFGLIGSFTADGAGGLSNIFILFDGGSYGFNGGWYAMDSSTHGTIQLTASSDPNIDMSFSIELNQGGLQGSLIETNGSIPGGGGFYHTGLAGSGSFMMQSPAAFDFGTGHFQGPYLLRLNGGSNTFFFPATTTTGVVGLLTVAPNSSTDVVDGTITGEADNNSGAHAQVTGTAVIQGTTFGWGQAFLNVTTVAGTQPSVTINFVIIDAGHVFVDDGYGNEGIFRFQKTSSGYTASDALNGTNLFEALGVNGSGHSSLIAGTLSVDPASPTTKVAGIYDANDGGTVPGTAPVTYGGTYTVTSEGRGTLTLTVNSSTVFSAVFYLRNTGQGFLLEQPVSGNTEGRAGQISPQTVPTGGFQDSTFTNLTAVGGTEIVTPGSVNGVGVVTVNGTTSPATYTGMGDTSLLGVAPIFGGTFSGQIHFTDSTHGRGTITTSAGSIFGSSSSVFYAISSTSIAVIPQDSTEPQLIVIQP